MIRPQIPDNENERLKELYSYELLDTPQESAYDNLTYLASQICGTEVSLITLIDQDRQWFKSYQGWDLTESPKEYSFCAHAINDPNDVFIVDDAKQDERFKDNPLVSEDPNISFYAGVPLVTDSGYPIGSFCVIDSQPKNLNDFQIKSLKSLANQAMIILKLRKSQLKLQKTNKELDEKNAELQHFAYVVAHDLKSPLSGISNMTDIVINKFASKIEAKGIEMLEVIKSSSSKLSVLIDSLLDYGVTNSSFSEDKTKITVSELKKYIANLFPTEKKIKINFNSTIKQLSINKTGLIQIFINLISNGIKYNDKENVIIDIKIDQSESHYLFEIKDNGPGIPEEFQTSVFNLFFVSTAYDKFGNKGSGIGLATVKRIIDKCDGTIHVDSSIGEGASFIFTLKK